LKTALQLLINPKLLWFENEVCAILHNPIIDARDLKIEVAPAFASTPQSGAG